MTADFTAIVARRAEERASPGAGFAQSWRAGAQPEQLPPDGEWRTAYWQGGRGSGKTYAGAHILAEWISEDPEPGEWGIVAPTYQDAWSTCVEGPSGFLAALGTSVTEVRDGKSRHVEHWHRSFAEIKLRNGHLIRVASAQDGGLRIQGKNLKGAWADEVGLWDNWDTTWNESLKFAVREGQARIVATGTPKQSRKARKLIKQLIDDPDVPVRRLRTIDNAENLAPRFLAEVVGKAKGTRLERQKLEGVLLDDVEGALWTAELIEQARMAAPPADLMRVVVAVDPAVSNEEGSDETGIMVVAEGEGGHGFVLEDASMRGTPDECMKRAVAAYHEHRADRVVGEANNGGDYIGTLLHTVDPNVPYTKVIATRGKRVRAEPVSALYEQLRIHHVGYFQDLEEQMLGWVPSDPGESPDRVDAPGLGMRGTQEPVRRVVARGLRARRAARTARPCIPSPAAAARPATPNCAAAPSSGRSAPGTRKRPPRRWAAGRPPTGPSKCGQGHVYIGRLHKSCPRCGPGGMGGQRPGSGSLPFAGRMR